MSQTLEIPITTETIRLGQLLKLAGVVDDGVRARELIEHGEVSVDGEVDRRRGRQVRPGSIVRLGDTAGAGRRLLSTPSTPARERAKAAPPEGTRPSPCGAPASVAVAVAVAGAAAAGSSSSFFSTTRVSVVRTIDAIDAALRSAERVTLTGSMTPALIRSPYSPVAALRPLPTLELAHLGDGDVALEAGVLGDPAQRLGRGLARR